MKTLVAIIEDNAGNVVAAALSDGSEVTLPAPLPRSQLAAHARELAEAFGVTLPENPAIPPAE
jgi:hypothetical protein